MSDTAAYGVRYKGGTLVPATNRQQAERVASNLGGRAVVILDVSTYDRLIQIERAAGEVMDALQTHGASIGHLLDNDSNSGERLRRALVSQPIG